MNPFASSRWIWAVPDHDVQINSYASFRFSLPRASERTKIKLSADSDFNLSVNGKLLGFGTYHDYEEHAAWEEVDLTHALVLDDNEVEILVWYYGKANFSYSLGKAGLIFTVFSGKAPILCSNEKILSSISRSYRSGDQKWLTGQLGFSYFYDASGEGKEEYSPSFAVDKPLPTHKRPIPALSLGSPVSGRVTSFSGNCRYLCDLGEERVGFLRLCASTDFPLLLTVTYGEYLTDGRVNRIIGDRDFSFEILTRAGSTDFTAAFRRLGCRYIEVEASSPFTLDSIGLIPTDYPLTNKLPPLKNPRHQAISELCVRTLRLCLHEHYEDCPWREQGLYTMDSRNQMLCGYAAFGELKAPRASLELFAASRPVGGILPLCAPCDHRQTIPSFTLHYYTEVREYLDASGDLSLIRSIYPKLCSMLSVFRGRLGESGLIREFAGPEYWNFYEWQPDLKRIHDDKEDLILNALYVRALREMVILSRAIGAEDVFSSEIDALIPRIRSFFFDPARGLYFFKKDVPVITELGNYLCVLTGICPLSEASDLISRLLSDPSRVQLTLSMRVFAYDAMLLADEKRFSPLILSDIETRWGRMLDEGSTTAWETETECSHDLHSPASELRGYSFCHGWSAVPLLYLHRLEGELG